MNTLIRIIKVSPTKPAIRTAALFLMTVLLSTSASAVFISGDRNKFKTGAVFARSFVLDEETNQLILVEFNEDGTEAGTVTVPDQFSNTIAELRIVAASAWRAEKARLEGYRTLRADDLGRAAILMERGEFLSQTYRLADNRTEISPNASLDENVKSVLVRSQPDRLSNDPNTLVLLEFSVNLKNNQVGANDTTLVLSDDGNIVARSNNFIGYRNGFFGDPNAPQDTRRGVRNRDDTIFRPIPGVRVFVSEFAYPGGQSATREDGTYSFRFRLPVCPVGGFTFTTDVYAEIPYVSFNPRGARRVPTYLRAPGFDYCASQILPITSLGSASAAINAIAANELSPIIFTQSDFNVDLMRLGGNVSMANLAGEPVTIGGETRYDAFDSPAALLTASDYAQRFDFNNDGTFDTVVLGTIVTETNEAGEAVSRFVRGPDLQGTEPDLLGVYFDASDVGTQSPDLVRIRDTELRINEQAGLLTRISLNDYRNTDILVFREATGELVVERRGFRDEEVNVTRTSRIGLDNQQKFFYNITSRGPSDAQSFSRPLRQFEDFNARNGLTESFRRRGENFLRPGETVRIVAINRATGYIGTARTALDNSAGNSGGAISILVPDIVMRPPNLKVWASRDLTVEHGLTQGEDRSFTIGTEGAALTSDTTVRILTEWLDHDGSPLPQGLTSDNGSDFGYTGRLARIVASGTLGGAGDQGVRALEKY